VTTVQIKPLLNYHSSAGAQVAIRPFKACITAANKFVISKYTSESKDNHNSVKISKIIDSSNSTSTVNDSYVFWHRKMYEG